MTVCLPSTVIINTLNKVIIVTGAGRGLGKALAIGLSRAGFTVVATARTKDKLKELESRLKGDYLIEKCDITDWDDCDELVKKVVGKYGQIDVLINNAGGAYVKSTLVDSTKEQIDSVFDTQVKGTAYMTKAVLTQMARQKSGKVYTITHLGYRMPEYIDAGNPKTLHLASLFGKAALADMIALEAKSYGVESIPVFIRWVASELDIDDELPTDSKANHPSEVVEAIIKDLTRGESQKEIRIIPLK